MLLLGEEDEDVAYVDTFVRRTVVLWLQIRSKPHELQSLGFEGAATASTGRDGDTVVLQEMTTKKDEMCAKPRAAGKVGGLAH